MSLKLLVKCEPRRQNDEKVVSGGMWQQHPLSLCVSRKAYLLMSLIHPKTPFLHSLLLIQFLICTRIPSLIYIFLSSNPSTTEAFIHSVSCSPPVVQWLTDTGTDTFKRLHSCVHLCIQPAFATFLTLPSSTALNPGMAEGTSYPGLVELKEVRWHLGNFPSKEGSKERSLA